jgi:hypothetical protein
MKVNVGAKHLSNTTPENKRQESLPSQEAQAPREPQTLLKAD